MVECPYYSPGNSQNKVFLPKLQCSAYIEGGFCSTRFMFRCLEHLKFYEPSLSYSQIKSHVRCRRLGYYDSIMGIEPISPPLPMLQGKIATEVLDILHSKDRDSEADYALSLPLSYHNEEKPEETLWTVLMQAFFEVYYASGYPEMKGLTQYKFVWKEPEYPEIVGFLDLMLETETIAYEFKWTKNPDWYEKFVLDDQLSCYFLGNPSLERITVRLLVAPELKLGKNEGIRTFRDRVMNDIARRKSHYIRDFNFWRTEFDLQAYKRKAQQVAREISEYAKIGIDAFYQNTQACFSPPCPFKPICTSGGVISDDLFRKKSMDKRIIEQVEGKRDEDISESYWKE